MTKTTTPKVSKTTFPDRQLTQDEWFAQFGVASRYTKPTPYYGGNEFNTEIFKRKQTTSSPGGILSGIINFLTTFTWAV
jgi:hypothetical protein